MLAKYLQPWNNNGAGINSHICLVGLYFSKLNYSFGEKSFIKILLKKIWKEIYLISEYEKNIQQFNSHIRSFVVNYNGAEINFVSWSSHSLFSNSNSFCLKSLIKI